MNRFEKEVLLLLRTCTLLLWVFVIAYMFYNHGDNAGNWTLIGSVIVFGLLLTLALKRP